MITFLKKSEQKYTRRSPMLSPIRLNDLSIKSPLPKNNAKIALSPLNLKNSGNLLNGGKIRI